jgi:hypothetical protein
MKKISFAFFLFLASNSLFSQSNFREEIPMSIGTFNYFFVHLGVKVGTQWDWRTWEKEKETKKRTFTKTKSLFISPQVGFYSHRQNHHGLLFNVNFGYQRVKSAKGFYCAYSLGVGYLRQFNAGITYVYEGNGLLTEKRAASRGYLMPSLNVELGQQINSKIGWFTKLSFASKLNYNTGASFDVFHEVGVKLNLAKLAESDNLVRKHK